MKIVSPARREKQKPQREQSATRQPRVRLFFLLPPSRRAAVVRWMTIVDAVPAPPRPVVLLVSDHAAAADPAPPRCSLPILKSSPDSLFCSQQSTFVSIQMKTAALLVLALAGVAQVS